MKEYTLKRKKQAKNIISYGKNNKGMSLVTVIISIGFVAILASILLMTSLINFKMKRINVYAKDSFYSAEQVLDEISIGLQKSISDALSASYMDVMTNYADETYTTQKKEEILQTKYYEYLWDVLGTDPSHTAYDTEVLYNFLKTSTKWRGSDTEGYGAILRSVDSLGIAGTTGVMVTYDKNGIVLKNLTVYYKDAKGFISEIKTDIRLAYPNYDFAASTALPDIPGYSFIADSGAIVNLPGGGSITLEGSAYADSVIVSANTNKTTLQQNGQTQLIVKHDLNLKNASYSNEETTELWSNDIIVESSDLQLKGESNVADDINIKGNGSTIKLAGYYNGFGNSLTDAEKSSAILVNGINSELDLANLTKLQLSGHAYVGVKSKIKNATEENLPEDVLTGESLAVKSNQLMYLVPSECIGVLNSTGRSLYQKNPLTQDEYNSIYNKTGITEISTDIEVKALGETLGSFIKTEGGIPKAEKVFVKTSAGPTLVYYYMKFVDEDAANDYFVKYYNINKESIDSYAKFYAESISFPNTESLIRLRMAGNALMGDTTNGFESKNTVIANASEKFASNNETNSDIFTAWCTKLIGNSAELTNLRKPASETEGVVYDNIVNETAFNSFIDKFHTSGANTVVLSETINSKNAEAVLTKGDYAVNSEDIHLVIAKGDVTVNVTNFTGTIIADGTVTFSKSCNLKSDEELVRSCLRFSQAEGDMVYPIASVFVGGSDLIYASLTEGEESESVSLADLVIYENWTKE